MSISFSSLPGAENQSKMSRQEGSKKAEGSFDWSKVGSRFNVLWLFKYPGGAKPPLSDDLIKASALFSWSVSDDVFLGQNFLGGAG